jgi:hypothetical protein
VDRLNIPSRLLGKVARGFDLPIRRSLPSAGISAKDGSGEGEHYRESEEGFLVSGNHEMPKKEELSDYSASVSESILFHPAEDNIAGQHTLNDGEQKKDIPDKSAAGEDILKFMKENNSDKNIHFLHSKGGAIVKSMEHAATGDDSGASSASSEGRDVADEPFIRDADDSTKNTVQTFEAGDFRFDNSNKHVETDVLRSLFPVEISENQKNSSPPAGSIDKDYAGEKKLNRDKDEYSGDKKNVSAVNKNIKTVAKEHIVLSSKNKIISANLKTRDEYSPYPEGAHGEEKGNMRYERETITDEGGSKIKKHFTDNMKNVLRKPAFKNEMPAEKKDQPLIKDQQRENKGVRIGKINIHFKGKDKAEKEELWPDVSYSDHLITEDWEWSCRYGR